MMYHWVFMLEEHKNVTPIEVNQKHFYMKYPILIKIAILLVSL